ncbi:hypothetical protein CC80DRAFT_407622 [Byssothecium circinans]|uniref:Uncharacterized protein n=1 Tax=Byssothecium circinans TaxID=147558 RepID=A0A6A5U0M3_9PLEO|nr:hypothetical protein CC80DRAFT_407622 [Byssothecium circinans]
MESWSPRDLKKRFRKLDCHLITSEPDSVIPSDKKHPSTVQASQYRDHPGVYPEFARFATFKHGIRKIFLKFSFCDYLHFFKVTAHSFDAWHRRGAFTCDVFQQLPHLNELVVALPTGAQIKQHPHDRAPHLFDDNFPCPRIILRLIYEQIAVELATYDNVTVLNFLDPEDEQHFNNLRQSARLELKFAPAEFKELYADDGGGIQIQSSEDEDATTTTTETATESLECDDVIKFPDTNFWPPPCICKYSCHDKFLGIVRKEE